MGRGINGYPEAVPVAPRQTGAMESDARLLVDQVNGLVDEAQQRLGGAINRMRDLADSLTGEEPIAPSTAPPSPSPSGRVSHAIYGVNLLHEQISYLNNQIERLARL